MRTLIVVSLAAAALTAGVVWIIWYLRAWSVSAAVHRGIVLMQSAQRAEEVDAAFAIWERETSHRWRGREAQLVDHVFARYAPGDPRVGAFLRCLVGADYGDRTADWTRWHEAWTRLREGKPPRLQTEEVVRLDPLWTAPIGLTAWFTPLLALDGQVYAGTLGSGLESADDPSDGLVHIDGATGVPSLIFTPPDRGPRDILGIAAGDRVIFLACRNGYVYCVAPDGTPRWKTFLGAAIASIPLVHDVNRDGVLDVIVATHHDKILALSGATGRDFWSASRGRTGPRRESGLIGVNLALGDLLGNPGSEIVATWLDGHVRILSAADGASRWRSDLPRNCFGGSVLLDPGASPGVLAVLADGAGGVTTILQAGRSLDALPRWQLGAPATLAMVAAPRTLIGDEAGRPWLLTCSSGTAGGSAGSVFALAGDDVRWRYSPGGVIWGTPAVANLNNDRGSEIVVASMDGDGAGFTGGRLSVLSHEGHLLKQLAFDSPLECSPLVADVNGDGKLDVLVADRRGTLHCFATRGIGPVEWGGYGGDKFGTRHALAAYAFGQIPTGHQWRWKP